VTRDTANLAITIALVCAFAAWVTVHVANVYGLVARRRILPAIGSLLVPPAAPFCSFVAGMRVRAALWVASAAAYVIALLLAR
jgi:hypothetical protein